LKAWEKHGKWKTIVEWEDRIIRLKVTLGGLCVEAFVRVDQGWNVNRVILRDDEFAAIMELWGDGVEHPEKVQEAIDKRHGRERREEIAAKEESGVSPDATPPDHPTGPHLVRSDKGVDEEREGGGD